MYIPCLNGIRAFAILLVLSSHIIHTGIPKEIQNLLGYGNLGTIGVRLFFLLSGFLITTILVNELHRTGKINIRKFFIRRVLRIFPCFYFFLIILGVLAGLGIIWIEFKAILFGFFYLQNLNVFQNTEAFATSWFVKHSWSLSVEEQFYFIYPFSIKRVIKKISTHPALFAILVTLICSFFRALNYSYPEISRVTGGVFWMHCDFLLYGALLNILVTKKREVLKKRINPYRYWLLGFSIAMIIQASRVEYYSVIHIILSGNLILAGNLYILLFFLLYPESQLGQIFEMKVVKTIGALSYGLYVWQQLFLGSHALWLKFDFVTLFPTNIVALTLCATTSYWLIEKPFLKLKKTYG